ncbi:hypothetical protein COV82_01670 [Candidatus Peregrinibacteria bacterium CG11_big_fil_rev_8_21_14_0_20_46_8]|nr:MAG: hypothetical protein COV82_01670 [Candidatus Peregrinibacteria bacterium CG11_big_fil_rev_8_21_14_0_20_46_8]
MDNSEARILENVKKAYDTIADEFDRTRRNLYSQLEIVVQLIPKSAKSLLDAGCGNGRLLNYLNPQIEYLGIDNSRELLKHAKKRYPQGHFEYGDILALHAIPQKFDVITCIAVFHHIPNKELQLQALQEMRERLNSNGRLIITVWNLFNTKLKRYIDSETHDANIPWGHSNTFRFFHAFTAPELRQLLEQAGFQKVRQKRDPQNHIFSCHAP